MIRGGQFVVENAFVQALTDGGNDGEKGAGIDIRVSTLDMHNFDQEKPALISTDTFGLADGGDVFIEADIMRVAGAGFCPTCDLPTGILAQTFSEGDAGNIKVIAGQINLETGGTLSTATFAEGEGGDLDVEADHITLDGEGGFTTQSAPDCSSGVCSATAGNAGNIDIKTNGLTLINGARIIHSVISLLRVSDAGSGGARNPHILPVCSGSCAPTSPACATLATTSDAMYRSLTGGPGRGGDISIQADRIFISGSSFIASQQRARDGIGTGRAGDINVKGRGQDRTKHLEVRDGAQLNAITAGRGDGGNIFVTADNILLVGDPSIEFTGLSNESKSDGNAGSLTVTAHTLEIRDNARIEASTLFAQETGADQFSGKGGNITVTADDIFISGKGAGIVAKSTNRNPAATSSQIRVIANDSIRLQNRGTISVETVLADAGDIDIQANELLLLRDEGSITTSVAGGAGSGGNIRIDPVFTILDSGSRIVAQAREGASGNIRIVSDFFFRSPDSVVDASSELGIDGVVDIESPDTDLNAGLVELPADFFDAATLLTQGCAPGAELSRLVVRKYEVLPESPAALRVPPPGGLLNADAQGRGFALTRETLGACRT